MYMKKFFLFSIVFLTITAFTAFKANTASKASEAKARLMTLEEIRSFEPGFACIEEHCELEGTTCGAVESADCCVFSAESACEFEAEAEKCVQTGCGGIFDPCDKECVWDDDADCGRDVVIACIPNRCWVFFLYDWNGPVAYGGTCDDMGQCHTVDH